MSIRTTLRRRVAQVGLALAVTASLALGSTALAQETDLSTLTGSIEIDGSSTVVPVTEAVAEEFAAAGASEVDLSIGVSGTGGGFERFCAGETDISNASRAIDEDEIALCAENGVEYYEFLVGLDGITVVVNPANTFLSCVSLSTLANIWAEDAGYATWAEVNPEFPAEPLNLYGAGPDSGTFDFFNEVVLGEERAPTTNYTPSEDDNVLVEGVAGDPNALGYFGFAYYQQNQDVLTAVALATQDDLSDCTLPTTETIADGSYPISRPLYIYVNAESITEPAVQEFVRFYAANAEALVEEVGYVVLPAEQYTALAEKAEGAISGEVEPDSSGAAAEATPEA